MRLRGPRAAAIAHPHPEMRRQNRPIQKCKCKCTGGRQKTRADRHGCDAPGALERRSDTQNRCCTRNDAASGYVPGYDGGRKDGHNLFCMGFQSAICLEKRPFFPKVAGEKLKCDGVEGNESADMHRTTPQLRIVIDLISRPLNLFASFFTASPWRKKRNRRDGDAPKEQRTHSCASCASRFSLVETPFPFGCLTRPE